MNQRDEFPERLRRAARELRYSPDDPFVADRIRSGVERRIASRMTLAELLAAWFRPLAAAAAAFALVVAVAGSAIENSVTPEAFEMISPIELLEEDYYHVAR